MGVDKSNKLEITIGEQGGKHKGLKEKENFAKKRRGGIKVIERGRLENFNFSTFNYNYYDYKFLGEFT